MWLQRGDKEVAVLNVADASVSQIAGDGDNLIDNFRRLQMTGQTHLTGRAKSAADGAAHLG